MSEKVVVITGASSGIGAALARNLGSKGYAVALAARREDRLRQVAAESGSHALPIVTDLTQRDQVDRLRDAAIREFGHVDVWVNNAGRGITRKVIDLTDQDLDDMIAVNVKSALYGMQTIIPDFCERGEGHLINVSSFLGRVPLVTVRSAYNAAKSALNALTANLRMDLHPMYPGIHISLVMPGIVATEFQEVAGTPMRPGAPGAQSAEEVAELIADLIEHPAAELYTRPELHGRVMQYYQDVAAFESQLG